MKTKLQWIRRRGYAALALALTAALGLTAVAPTVFAGTGAQVQSRSIEISNSTVSATGVSYLVTFTAETAALSLVMDFCQNSPIEGATCTTTNGVTFTSPGVTNGNLPTGWAFGSATGSTVKVAGTTTALTPGTSYNFTIAGVNNPTVSGSFYARIYTYANNTYGTYSSATSLGNDVDWGGFALSTASNISISATVMETLTFCATGLVASNPPTNCSAPTTPSVILGSGTPPTIDSLAVYDNSTGNYRTWTVLSTNAQHGAIVRMKTTNTCSGLSTNGGTDSCPIPGLSTAGAITAGTAAFGLHVGAGSGGTGTVTGTGSYGTGGTTYWMDNGASGVTSTYGSNIEASTSAVNNVVNQLTFATTANPTTPAGIYTANEILIATGTF